VGKREEKRNFLPSKERKNRDRNGKNIGGDTRRVKI